MPSYLDYHGLQTFKGELDEIFETKMDADKRGANNGVASLDENGKVPLSQLPGGGGGGTDIIDDTATYGDTDKAWSADKLEKKFRDAKNNPVFTGGIIFGHGNVSEADSISVSEWAQNTEYVVGDICSIDITPRPNPSGEYLFDIYRCKTAHTSGNTFDVTKWDLIGGQSTEESTASLPYKEYAEVVGNGWPNGLQSNARRLDWDGNEELAGDLTVFAGSENEVSVSELKNEITQKYEKPSGGIPKTDLADSVQTSLGKADTAYQKPSGGIPKTDLASAVQTSLGKADTALQGQDVSDAVDTYLAANFSNPSNPPLDRSLSSSLSAAPADMVGGLKNDLDSVEEIIGEVTENYSANIYTPSVTAVTNGYYIDSSGVETAEVGTNSWNVTDYIDIHPGSTLTYEKFYLTSSSMYSAFYDKNKAFVSSFKPNTDGASHTLSVPENAYYVRFTLKNSDVSRFVATAAGTFEEIRLQSGAYIEGNNVSDDLKSLDTQLTDVSVSEDGIKNEFCYIRTFNPVIYNPGVTPVVSDKYIKSNGTEGTANDFSATNYLSVKPGALLTYEKYYLIISAAYAAYYDRDKKFISNFKPNTDGTSHTLTVPDKAEYVRFSIKDGDLDRFKVSVKYRDYDYLEVPSYYFDDDYLSEKVERIREVMDSLNGNYDAFIFITDIHWLMNQQHSPALIKYLTERLNIPRLFDGGDRANGINMECNTVMRRAHSGQSYFIIGNHEYINGIVDYDGNVDKNFVTNDGAMYSEYNSFRDDIDTDNALRGYYYIENKLQKIRYIILASFAYDDGSAATGGYEEEQLTWFTNAVNSTPAGWHILVLTHFLVSTTIAEYRKRFTDVLVNYTGNAKIIGIIEGHNHLDKVFSSDDETPTVVSDVYTASEVPILSVTCDKNERWQSGGEVSELQLQDRPDGTIKEQAFDVIILDKTNKVIHQIRIGCPIREGTDPETWTEMEERKTRFFDIT